MPTLDKFPLGNYNNGIVREAAVDSTLVPQNTVEFAQNFNFDIIGGVQTRQGLTLLGSQIVASTPVYGMTNYRNNAGTNYKALAKVGSDVYSYGGSGWNAVRGSLTTDSKASFTNFVDYTFMVNGNANQVCSTYNGSGVFGSTNVASLPKGDFIENYRSRIWVADNSTDKVYYSNVVTTAGTITGGSEYIQVSPQDGERITGLKRHSRALLVFKNNHIYRIFSINAADPDPSITVGTYSNESIVETKSGLFFHHPNGFYQFSFDGNPQEISRPIIDIVQNITRTNYNNIAGWCDDDHVYWSVGDVTVGGITYANLVCRYTLSTQIWTLYSYSTQITSSALYDNGTTLTQLVGDEDGNVLQFNTGYSDNGSPINYDLTTHWMYFTNLKSTAKSINEIAVIHENAQGMVVSYQLDGDNYSKWRSIGSISKDLYQIMALNAKNFIRIRFRISGNSTGYPMLFRGFESLNMESVGEISK
jgi:hypothetical protein